MDATEKLNIINAALCHLGLMLPGEMPSREDSQYLHRELDAILATPHLILAERIALQYKVATDSADPKGENATSPRAGDKAHLERELTVEEVKMLEESTTCSTCGHLHALHNVHCCTFCLVDGCNCAD